MSTDPGALGIAYADGEVICRQGEKGDRMYVIQDGGGVVIREEAGDEVVVGELATGDIFGEMSIFDNASHNRTQTSVEIRPARRSATRPSLSIVAKLTRAATSAASISKFTPKADNIPRPMSNSSGS